MLPFPECTKFRFLEGSESESERDGCALTDFDQFVDDQSQQLVNLNDWVWHQREPEGGEVHGGYRGGRTAL